MLYVIFCLDFRTSKTSIHKSKEKLSSDGAEEKLLQKEEEAKIVTRVDMVDAKYAVGDHRNGDAKIELDANKRVSIKNFNRPKLSPSALHVVIIFNF